jgi:hypothetical protein
MATKSGNPKCFLRKESENQDASGAFLFNHEGTKDAKGEHPTANGGRLALRLIQMQLQRFASLVLDSCGAPAVTGAADGFD